MDTQEFLRAFIKDDNIVEFSIQYTLSTIYGFNYYELVEHLPSTVSNEEELIDLIKDYIMKSDFIKEIDKFNTLDEITDLEFN
jgi:hypothetical protein